MFSMYTLLIYVVLDCSQECSPKVDNNIFVKRLVTTTFFERSVFVQDQHNFKIRHLSDIIPEDPIGFNKRTYSFCVYYFTLYVLVNMNGSAHIFVK